MDDDDFPRHGWKAGLRAIEEAARRGSNTVEAEHLLLALSADSTTAASKVLADVGLDHDAIDVALREERARSLAIAGVVAGAAESTMGTDASRIVATPRPGRPAWGTSLREVLRTMRGGPSRDRRRRAPETELLVGILRAELGTVPRALAIAGIDRIALIDRLKLL